MASPELLRARVALLLLERDPGSSEAARSFARWETADLRDRVRSCRELGLTQAEVAAQLGVAQASVQNWERDRKRPGSGGPPEAPTAVSAALKRCG